MKRNFYYLILLGLILPLIYLHNFFIYSNFSIHILPVVGKSMEPLIYEGDLVILKKISGEKIERGEIVGIDCGKKILIHRVCKILAEKFVLTKGDNNKNEDALSLISNAKWKYVTSFPFLGYFLLVYFKNIPLISLLLAKMAFILCIVYKKGG